MNELLLETMNKKRERDNIYAKKCEVEKYHKNNTNTLMGE